MIGYVSILLFIFCGIFHCSRLQDFSIQKIMPNMVNISDLSPYGVSKISANHLSVTVPYTFTSLKMSTALKKRKIAVLGSRSVGEYWELTCYRRCCFEPVYFSLCRTLNRRKCITSSYKLRDISSAFSSVQAALYLFLMLLSTPQ